VKFLIDNNLSPHLAKALDALSSPQGHLVAALRDKFPASTPDHEWIEALASEGGWVILSIDQFKKSALEKKAIAECGLLVFCLDRQWARFDFWLQAERLVKWWPKILAASDLLGPGRPYRVPWAVTNGRFNQVK
jgi:hypothetical protein